MTPLINKVLNWISTEIESSDKKKDIVLDLNKFCNENSINSNERTTVTQFFKKMGKDFDNEYEKLKLSNSLVELNEIERFEQIRKILEDRDPPLFYIKYYQKKWIIPMLFDTKYEILEQSFEKNSENMITDLKQLSRYNEYRLSSEELTAESIASTTEMLESISECVQTVLRPYHNAMREKFVKNAKISRVYNKKLLETSYQSDTQKSSNIQEFEGKQENEIKPKNTDSIWAKSKHKISDKINGEICHQC